MKYALVAVLFLGLGYGLSMLITPADLGLADAVASSESLDATTQADAVSAQADKVDLATSYPDGSYLTEADLISIPGVEKPLGFRVGPPIAAGQADSLIKRLGKPLPAVKSRYITANSKQAVIVIAGNYADYDSANKDLRVFQKILKERLEIIYLPDCVQANSPDNEGYVCAPPAPKDDAATAAAQ